MTLKEIAKNLQLYSHWMVLSYKTTWKHFFPEELKGGYTLEEVLKYIRLKRK